LRETQLAFRVSSSVAKLQYDMVMAASTVDQRD